MRAPRTSSSESNFWTDRPTLVTGATGLVGSHLVRRLVELDAEVVCLVRDWNPLSLFAQDSLAQQVQIVWGDVRDQGLLERVLGEHEIQTVHHLAAQAIVGVANRNTRSTFESNVAGTWSLLEACRRSPCVGQVVLASSDKAYGAQPNLPYIESCALNPIHPYDVSKACAELVARSYAGTFDLPVAITRCGNFFGPGDLNWNRIVPGTIRSVLRGQRPVIRSDGQFVRDYFHVADGAGAYLRLAECLAKKPELAGEAFNFSLEEPLTALELVQHILRQMNSPLRPEIRGEATHEIRSQHLSAAKAREVLGWRPAHSLATGLADTITWYRRFFEQPSCGTWQMPPDAPARSA